MLTIDFQCFTSGNTVVFHCIESMQSYHDPKGINRACCTCFWASNLHWNRFSSQLQAPYCSWRSREQKTCKLSADSRPPTKQSSYCKDRLDLRNQSQRGIQEAASPTGEQLNFRVIKKWMRRKSTNLHPKLLLLLPVSSSAQLHLQAFHELFSWQWPEKWPEWF